MLLSQMRPPQQGLSVPQDPSRGTQHMSFSHSPKQHSLPSVQEPPGSRQSEHTPVVPLGLQKKVLLQH